MIEFVKTTKPRRIFEDVKGTKQNCTPTSLLAFSAIVCIVFQDLKGLKDGETI